MDIDTQALTLRQRLVDQIRRHGVRDERVLAAMGKVPRHRFIPRGEENLEDAYGDHPCAIGHGQTISQPFIVAYMTERLRVRPGDKILEIGTGCGYQAAILAELGARVFTLEVIGELAEQARRRLADLGYSAIEVRQSSGYDGWPEESPFQAILGACSPPAIPPVLGEQLAEGGRMILPVGVDRQCLEFLEKRSGRLHGQRDLPVRFVPMI